MDFITNNWASIILVLLQCGLLQFAYSLYKEYEKKEEEKKAKRIASDIAIRSLLRTEIIGLCHKAEKEGFIAVYNMENLAEMYNAYHELGGNGSISELYNMTMCLPHVPQGGN